ncbi:MAG TPA: hypothetical protein VIY56_18440 [Vicinamibacterales bacterium]
MASIACALALTAACGYVLLRTPFEVSEVTGNLLGFRTSPSAWGVTVAAFSGPSGSGSGFLRNLSFATGKQLFDLANGHYFLTYRLFHVALIATLLLLLVRLVRVDSATTWGLAVLSSLALLGIHPFHEAVRETETNIKLIVPACVFVCLALSASSPARWKDVAAMLLAFYGFFANELGLLLWVVLAAGYLVGFRGVSRSAVLGATALLGLYFYLRFVQWDVGTPAMTERPSGFGFQMYEARQLVTMFEANPYPFYLYNVAATFLSVLFTEPRAGAFGFTRDLLSGSVQMGLLFEVLTSTLTTGVMAWFVVRRVPHWWRLEFAHDDRIFLVAAAVLAGNAAISFPYAKEVSMSTGGTAYALAMFPALHAFVANGPVRLAAPWRVLGVYALVACISLGWTLRGVSFFVDLRRSASRAQNDWVSVYEWMDSQGMAPLTAEDRAIIDGVRGEALSMSVPRDYRESRWLAWMDPVH